MKRSKEQTLVVLRSLEEQARRQQTTYVHIGLDLLQNVIDVCEFGQPVVREPCGCVSYENVHGEVSTNLCEEHSWRPARRKLARD